jgi:heme/copper-type cytochrome/quinol oxidase subunit 2
MARLRRKSVSVFAFASLGLVAAVWTRTTAGTQGQVREFSIEGNQFAFSPGRIEVQKDDLVKVTFTARDMAHSFTIDEYRIAKRAGAGQTVVFEFRADRSGPFTFYCNLSQSDRCREMKGHLEVR